MTEEVRRATIIQKSADGTWYATAGRSDGIWLSVETFPLPVPDELKRPDIWGAAVIPGRDYWRRFSRAPMRPGEQVPIDAESAIVQDYLECGAWSSLLEALLDENAAQDEEIGKLHELLADAETKLAIAVRPEPVVTESANANMPAVQAGAADPEKQAGFSSGGQPNEHRGKRK